MTEMEFCDDDATIYGYTNDRTRKGIERFLNHFSDKRRECADEYEYPQYAEVPEAVFDSEQSILDKLQTETFNSYQLYWNVDASANWPGVQQLIAIYNEEGGVILGIVTRYSLSSKILGEFQSEFDVNWAILTGEDFPPTSFAQFSTYCKSAKLPHIDNGKLFL
jgi:hypothetical protein